MKRTQQRFVRLGGMALVLTAAAGFLTARIESRQATLFVIERNTNANVVHYDANIGADGRLDPREPVTAYWVMAAQDGHREELTPLEKSRAFGFSVQPGQDSNSYRMKLVAQRQKDISIVRRGEEIHAEAVIGGRHAWLQRMYVNAHKVLAIPTVKYIDFFGVDLATGESVSERFTP